MQTIWFCALLLVIAGLAAPAPSALGNVAPGALHAGKKLPVHHLPPALENHLLTKVNVTTTARSVTSTSKVIKRSIGLPDPLRSVNPGFVANLPRIQPMSILEQPANVDIDPRRVAVAGNHHPDSGVRDEEIDDNALLEENLAKTVPPYLFEHHEPYLVNPFHLDMPILTSQPMEPEDVQDFGVHGSRIRRHAHANPYGQPQGKRFYEHHHGGRGNANVQRKTRASASEGARVKNRQTRSLEFRPPSPNSSQRLLPMVFDIVRGNCFSWTGPDREQLLALEADLIALIKNLHEGTNSVGLEDLGYQIEKCHSVHAPAPVKDDFERDLFYSFGASPLNFPQMYPNLIASNEIDVGEPLSRSKRFRREMGDSKPTELTYFVNQLFKTVRSICSSYVNTKNLGQMQELVERAISNSKVAVDDENSEDSTAPVAKRLQNCIVN